MKKHYLFRTMLLSAMAMLLAFTSCKDDDDDEEPAPSTIVLNGFYIKGASTAYTDFNDNAMMTVTRNEVTQEDRSSLMEIYIPIKAGSDGFNIVQVAGDTKTTFGPSADFAVITNPTQDEPKNAPFKRGNYEESSTAFTVDEDGLYHVVIDTELKKVVVAKVIWGVIGAATPGGWSDDTELTPKGFDQEKMEFEATNIAMVKGDYKFRYSGGWKIELDTVLDLGDGNKGVKVNTNYGNTLADLLPGGDNINNDVRGYYTINMTWAADGYTATLTKTGDLEVTDYSAYEMGIVGDGIMVDGNQHNWDETAFTHTPSIDGTNYTWTYNSVEVTTAGSFKIRQGQDWNGLVIGYPQVTMAGGAAGDFDTNGDGNFVPTVDGGVYNFTLLIDAANEEYTLTVESAK